MMYNLSGWVAQMKCEATGCPSSVVFAPLFDCFENPQLLLQARILLLYGQQIVGVTLLDALLEAIAVDLLALDGGVSLDRESGGGILDVRHGGIELSIGLAEVLRQLDDLVRNDAGEVSVIAARVEQSADHGEGSAIARTVLTGSCALRQRQLRHDVILAGAGLADDDAAIRAADASGQDFGGAVGVAVLQHHNGHAGVNHRLERILVHEAGIAHHLRVVVRVERDALADLELLAGLGGAHDHHLGDRCHAVHHEFGLDDLLRSGLALASHEDATAVDDHLEHRLDVVEAAARVAADINDDALEVLGLGLDEGLVEIVNNEVVFEVVDLDVADAVDVLDGDGVLRDVAAQQGEGQRNLRSLRIGAQDFELEAGAQSAADLLDRVFHGHAVDRLAVDRRDHVTRLQNTPRRAALHGSLHDQAMGRADDHGGVVELLLLFVSHLRLDGAVEELIELPGVLQLQLSADAALELRTNDVLLLVGHARGREDVVEGLRIAQRVPHAADEREGAIHLFLFGAGRLQVVRAGPHAGLPVLDELFELGLVGERQRVHAHLDVGAEVFVHRVERSRCLAHLETAPQVVIADVERIRCRLRGGGCCRLGVCSDHDTVLVKSRRRGCHGGSHGQ